MIKLNFFFKKRLSKFFILYFAADNFWVVDVQVIFNLKFYMRF